MAKYRKSNGSRLVTLTNSQRYYVIFPNDSSPNDSSHSDISHCTGKRRFPNWDIPPWPFLDPFGRYKLGSWSFFIWHLVIIYSNGFGLF